MKFAAVEILWEVDPEKMIDRTQAFGQIEHTLWAWFCSKALYTQQIPVQASLEEIVQATGLAQAAIQHTLAQLEALGRVQRKEISR